MRQVALIVPLALIPLAAGGCGGSSSKAAGSGTCTSVTAPTPRRNGGMQKPRVKLSPHTTYTVTVDTNCGQFAFALDVKDSPNTTAAFDGLVRDGFFNGLAFHRIVPGFVIQGGDPTGTGAGGPGFSTVDPPPRNADYTLGTVAMAKTQTEPAGAAGSQFFVVTGRDAQLPPDYALLGKVTKGLDVVERIGRLGNPRDPNGTPTHTVVMRKVTVSP